jgi:uncharacterized RDD family membrane protein YckC
MSILTITEPEQGYAGKLRVFAMGLDYAVLFVVALLAGKFIPGNLVKGLSVAILYVLYFIVPEWKLSKTFGKALFGLEVRTHCQ